MQVIDSKQGSHTSQNWTHNTIVYAAVIGFATALTYIPLVLPFSLLRVIFYSAICFSVYSRMKDTDKSWCWYLPLAACIIDVTPVLSLIPVVPSLLNLTGITLSFVHIYKEKQQNQEHEKPKFKNVA